MLGLTPIVFALVWLGSWHHNSIPQLLLATIVFRVFSILSLSDKVGKIVSFVAPSMFAVYLLHVSGVSYFVITKINALLIKDVRMPIYMAYSITGMLVFSVAFVVDVIRRMVLLFCIKVCQMKNKQC